MTDQPVVNRPWEYSAFRVAVAGKKRIAPGFIRITFSGESLRYFAPWGLDQRIKLVLPMPDGTTPGFGLLEDPTPHPKQWHTRWKQLPEGERNALRTYTPAAIRPEVGEIDVDIYLHQPAGPASTWAESCALGDELVLTGPDSRAGYTGYGIHYTPPVAPGEVLLVGDATALPASNNILQSLPAGTQAQVFLELDNPANNLLSVGRPGAQVHVVEPSAEGDSRLEAAVRTWGSRRAPSVSRDSSAYAWIAGEATVTTNIRRYLTTELGWSKDRVASLGYWNRGGRLVG